MVHEKLSHSAGLATYEKLPVISSSTSGYRRKARLAVRHVGKKERVLVGFRERQSAFIADMQSCTVLDPLVSDLLPALADLVLGMECKAHLPQIEVAVGDAMENRPSHALVFRHLIPLTASDILGLEAFGQAHGMDIYLQPKGQDSVHKLYPAGTPDRLYYEQPEFNLVFAFHPLDFTQVNAVVNKAMVKKALELLEPQQDETVLDLFCGLGNFTLPLATRAAHVTGVEGVDAMVSRGQENAALNGIVNATFLRADLTRPPSEHAWLKQGFDKVLLDPPRSGALEVLPAVIAAKPKRIVYVSCSPATLARDTEYLQEQGYVLKAAGAMDMFPHTSHVEAMALFVPRGA
jgi:23S rRNA (uracil1939-C5)-methyltransferase